MNKTETARQLRLAAELIETGHPWHLYRAGRLYDTNPHMSAAYYAANRNSPEGPFEIRPILATPPDGRPLHNPDNLTAEQVGIGYRLTLTDDRKLTPWMQRWSKSRQMWDVVAFVIDEDMSALESTYRLPLSVPWPEAKLDPYAELKAAHAAGKAIETQMPNGEWFDYNPGDPQWNLQPECYRIKPEPPAFQLPPPPPGMRWHREDGWKEGDLPQGYRPLAKGERIQLGDEGVSCDGFAKFKDIFGKYPFEKARTTRLLTFTHEGKLWMWHRPGDPMPCNGEAWVECLCNHGGTLDVARAKVWSWNGNAIGWRYAEPETKTVPLGPDDVPPCSAVKVPSDGAKEYAIVCGVGNHGIILSDGRVVSFDYINSYGWKINRSIPLTGKWDPTAWEPCHKTISPR